MTQRSSSKSPKPEKSRKNLEERRIYGMNACLARFAKQPQTIIRGYVSQDRLSDAKHIFSYLADQRKAYHVVDAETLEKVFGTKHHEGIGLLVRESVPRVASEFVSSLTEGEASCVLILDGVDNPHNLGAITRVAAHFNCLGIWSGYSSSTGAVSDPFQGSYFRNAEGGAECLTKGYGTVDETVELCRRLKSRGFRIYGTSGRTIHKPRPLYDSNFSDKQVLVFGSEKSGISDKILKICDELLIIPGSGHVESLNVACAASVVLGESLRQLLQAKRNVAK